MAASVSWFGKVRDLRVELIRVLVRYMAVSARLLRWYPASIFQALELISVIRLTIAARVGGGSLTPPPAQPEHGYTRANWSRGSAASGWRIAGGFVFSEPSKG